MTLKAIFSAILAIISVTASVFAENITTTFDNDSGDNRWFTASNWDPDVQPNNGADFYDVVIPGNLASPVTLIQSPTVETLNIGTGSILDFGGSSLTLKGDITNDGQLLFSPSSSSRSLFFSGRDGAPISLLGSGLLRLAGTSHLLLGGIDQEVTHGTNHTIAGFGNFGSNRMSIVNHGSVLADVSGQVLTIDPADTFVNDGGLVRVENGATLTLSAGRYSSVNAGRYEIADGSNFNFGNADIENLTLSADDTDNDLSNNIARAIGDFSIGENVINEVTFNLGGRAVFISEDTANNGIIDLTSGGVLFVRDPENNDASLSGSGTLLMATGGGTVSGDSNHRFTNEAGHTIRGSGVVGANRISLINRGLIEADDSGETLAMSPASDFTNDGGILASSNGGTLRLNSATYTTTNGGIYRVGDNSPLFFDNSTIVGGTFIADDQDGDLTNNSPTFSSNNPTFFGGITNETHLEVPDGADLRLIGDIVNNGTIHIAEDGDFLLEGGLGTEVRLDGVGTMVVDTRFDRQWHPGKTFINGPGHTLEVTQLTGNAPGIGNGAFITTFVNEGTVKMRSDIRGSIHSMRILQNSGIYDTQGAEMGDPRDGIVTFVTINGGEYVTGSRNDGVSVTMNDGVFSFGDGSPRESSFNRNEQVGDDSSTTPDMNFRGGVLEMKIESATSFDRLYMDGFVEINGTELALKLIGPASGFDNFSNRVLIAAGGLSDPGSFSSSEFSNVVSGGRLLTVDGRASFVVTFTSETVIGGPVGWTRGEVELSLPLFGPEWGAAPYAFSIPAGSASGFSVGSVSAVDPEGDAFTYSLAAGSPFAIDSSGQIAVADAAAVADSTTYNLAVDASDGLHTNTTIVTITVGSGSPDTNESCVRQLLSEAGGAFAGETDPAIIGAMADPDGDGIANLFELWFGTDPSSSTDSAATNLEINPPYFDVTVLAAMDDLLEVEGEFSTDLSSGSFTPGTRSVLSKGSTHRVIRFSPTSLGSPRNFFRFAADLGSAK